MGSRQRGDTKRRFYRTYEGLKPTKSPTTIRLRSSCFYRTYEGLKPFCNVRDRKNDRCFYRTYEGLKRNTFESNLAG